jgi:Rrf2 family protein
MLKINKKAEYALLAIQRMSLNEGDGQVTSTREISVAAHIPYPVLSKVMQKLASYGVIKSIHGTKGGYILAKHPAMISVADVVQIFDGSIAVAECFRSEKITCPQWNGCTIKDPLSELNQKIFHVLAQTTVLDLMGTKHEEELPVVNVRSSLDKDAEESLEN